MTPSTFTYKLTPDQVVRLRHRVAASDHELREPPPYSDLAAVKGQANIVLYQSGKCVIQGKGAREWVEFIFEPEILQEARLGYEAERNPQFSAPHMGVDESGKGDFFGPLVIASVYVDADITRAFREAGVRDSKTVTSDRKIRELADRVREACRGRWALVAIGPRAYNKMYAGFGNVNKLLAWGHARAIENLLAKVPDCPRAVSDQFGPTHRIERALLEKGRAIQLEQRPKAEDDPAVAAASILAREGFINRLDALGEAHGVPLPKGASEAVRRAGETLVRRHGPGILLETAKCHFATADKVLAEVGMTRFELPPPA